MPVVGPPATLARMALAVGVTSDELATAGRADAARALEDMQRAEAKDPPQFEIDLGDEHLSIRISRRDAQRLERQDMVRALARVAQCLAIAFTADESIDSTVSVVMDALNTGGATDAPATTEAGAQQDAGRPVNTPPFSGEINDEYVEGRFDIGEEGSARDADPAARNRR